MKMKPRTTFDDINQLAELVLNIANYIDREGEVKKWPSICEELHMGLQSNKCLSA